MIVKYIQLLDKDSGLSRLKGVKLPKIKKYCV